MLIAEIILNVTFSTLACIAFFYVYKKSHLIVMLLAGAITYFELLCRLFLQSIPIAQTGINLLVLPEIAIIIYMAWYTFKDGFKWIPAMCLLLIVTFTLLMNIGHTFYGDLGVMFGLIMIIWVNQSTQPCDIDPFECNKPRKRIHCEGDHQCKPETNG